MSTKAKRGSACLLYPSGVIVRGCMTKVGGFDGSASFISSSIHDADLEKKESAVLNFLRHQELRIVVPTTNKLGSGVLASTSCSSLTDSAIRSMHSRKSLSFDSNYATHSRSYEDSSETMLPSHPTSCVVHEEEGDVACLESPSEMSLSCKNADSISSILSSHLSHVYEELEHNKDDLEKMWAATFARVRNYRKRCHESRKKEVR